MTRISQVLTNLVGNAVKFTDAGHVTISVSPDPFQPENTHFAVSDTMIGIEESEQSLFDAFTQASGGIQSMGGTGLGLAISKRIVQAMGGELRLESKIVWAVSLVSVFTYQRKSTFSQIPAFRDGSTSTSTAY